MRKGPFIQRRFIRFPAVANLWQAQPSWAKKRPDIGKYR
jgi:hypothetical protein